MKMSAVSVRTMARGRSGSYPVVKGPSAAPESIVPDGSLGRALLAIAVAQWERRPLPPSLNWGALLSAAAAQGLLPLANPLVQESDCPPDVKQAFRLRALGMALRGRQLEDELGGILEALEGAGADTIVLKGPALANTVYRDPSLRPYTDLDLLSREEHWPLIHQTLLHLGFAPLNGIREAPPPKIWPGKAYYHSEYYREEGRLKLDVHYDVWQSGLRPRLGEVFWNRAHRARIAGRPTRVLARDDQILQTCVHLHQHGYSRLIWLCDLALLMRSSQSSQINWQYVVQAARSEGIELSVYFSLCHLRRLLGVASPPWVPCALRPGFLLAWLHNRVWPPEAIPRPPGRPTIDFQFHELPKARALVLNLLFTGRRWEKASYLAHLLVPPAAWLAHYYDASDPATLRRRRLAHTPKLLLKALGGLRGFPHLLDGPGP